MVKGRVRFPQALSLLHLSGGCSDGYPHPSTPAGQAVRWHPAFIPLAPALSGGLCHSSPNREGSFWLRQALSRFVQLLRDSPMQPTKTI